MRAVEKRDAAAERTVRDRHRGKTATGSRSRSGRFSVRGAYMAPRSPETLSRFPKRRKRSSFR